MCERTVGRHFSPRPPPIWSVSPAPVASLSVDMYDKILWGVVTPPQLRGARERQGLG